jgi:hypothetical protein
VEVTFKLVHAQIPAAPKTTDGQLKLLFKTLHGLVDVGWFVGSAVVGRLVGEKVGSAVGSEVGSAVGARLVGERVDRVQGAGLHNAFGALQGQSNETPSKWHVLSAGCCLKVKQLGANEVFDKSKLIKLLNPFILGIGPVNPLFDRFKYLKLLNKANSVGKFPVRPPPPSVKLTMWFEASHRILLEPQLQALFAFAHTKF